VIGAQRFRHPESKAQKRFCKLWGLTALRRPSTLTGARHRMSGIIRGQDGGGPEHHRPKAQLLGLALMLPAGKSAAKARQANGGACLAVTTATIRPFGVLPREYPSCFGPAIRNHSVQREVQELD
jgi:hypothetical protein